MNKVIVGLMAGVCALLGGMVVLLQTKEDNTPPVIQFRENDVIYTAGDDYDEFLIGVIALDDRDGDVTDTLVVESVYPKENEKKATVIYVARDKSNNIGKAKREIVYQEEENNVSSNSTGKSAEGEEKLATALTGTNNSGDPVQYVENIDEETEDDVEDSGQEELQGEMPQIKLKTDHVSIKIGEYVNRLRYVDSIVDDKDSSDRLWRSISIAGDQLDSNEPGVYELIYYVIDSDGNKSNEEKLTITVE